MRASACVSIFRSFCTLRVHFSQIGRPPPYATPQPAVYHRTRFNLENGIGLFFDERTVGDNKLPYWRGPFYFYYCYKPRCTPLSLLYFYKYIYMDVCVTLYSRLYVRIQTTSVYMYIYIKL